MSSQKKYYFSFYGMNGENNTVEIWQDTVSVLVAEEIQGMDNPFSVELPSLDNKFQPVRGTGCRVTINCKDNMKFFNGLYHVNPREFIIKHFINGSLNWVGYMNSELFRETYSDFSNYSVDFTGNDGFSLMERFHFIDDLKNPYVGIKSEFDILRLIFTKIGLSFDSLNICLSTTFDGQIIDDTSILHQTFVDCANFYNEDGEPETLRKVLEAMLLPYGAFIEQYQGNLYVTDIHNLATNSTIEFKSFNLSTGAYIGLIEISTNHVEIQSIGYAGTGQGIEVSGGKNKQIVSYSPYPLNSILPSAIADDSEFGTIPEDWDYKLDYNFKTLYNNQYFNVFAPATFEASYNSTVGNSNDGVDYLRIPWMATKQLVASLKVNPYLVISAADATGTYTTDIFGVRKENYKGLSFFINGDIRVVCTNNTYGGSTVNVTAIGFFMKIRCGNMYYNTDTQGNNSWNTDSTKYFLEGTFANDGTLIADKWVALRTYNNADLSTGIKIPILENLSGDFYFEIYSTWKHSARYIMYDNHSGIYELWLKKLSITLVESSNKKEVGDSDMEYVGYLDYNFKDESEQVDLICGSDVTKADRGKLMYFTSNGYGSIKSWTRNNQSCKIEELLLGSLSSNYKSGFYTLSSVQLNNTIKPFNVLMDSEYLPNRKFMVGGYNINYQESTVNCDLIEISADNLIIKK